jgi:uncharacterized RDD family membrane protein YckC
VVDRRDLGAWLDGPGAGLPAVQDYPGQRLGRPQDGDGSVGRFGRRLGGLVVDWAIALLIARFLIGNGSLAPLAVFLAEHVLLVGTAGATIGHRVFGLRVETVAGAHPGPLKALVRSLLVVLVVPPLVMDADARGLHDRAVGTIVARR